MSSNRRARRGAAATTSSMGQASSVVATDDVHPAAPASSPPASADTDPARSGSGLDFLRRPPRLERPTPSAGPNRVEPPADADEPSRTGWDVAPLSLSSGLDPAPVPALHPVTTED